MARRWFCIKPTGSLSTFLLTPLFGRGTAPLSATLLEVKAPSALEPEGTSTAPAGAQYRDQVSYELLQEVGCYLSTVVGTRPALCVKQGLAHQIEQSGIALPAHMQLLSTLS